MRELFEGIKDLATDTSKKIDSMAVVDAICKGMVGDSDPSYYGAEVRADGICLMLIQRLEQIRRHMVEPGHAEPLDICAVVSEAEAREGL